MTEVFEPSNGKHSKCIGLVFRKQTSRNFNIVLLDSALREPITTDDIL